MPKLRSEVRAFLLAADLTKFVAPDVAELYRLVFREFSKTHNGASFSEFLTAVEAAGFNTGPATYTLKRKRV